MKSAVETLSPTRIKLTVEVPFDELQPSVTSAYRKIAQQIRLKGFRPGKAPPALIDRQVGRGLVLEEAVQDALPKFYGEALREHDLHALGHPELDVGEFADGGQLTFTAEVDVRPPIELPAYDSLEVTVDSAEPSDADVDEQVAALRDRFATLSTVDRPATTGDYVSIDLATSIDDKPVEEASATGLSYEVGSGQLLDRLDEAVTGLVAGAEKAFETTLRDGRAANVTVTVRSVREKSLPALDDDFAQTASEFDTLAELRDDVRNRLTRVRRLQQGIQARDRVHEALLGAVDVPIPEHVLADEVAARRSAVDQQLASAGLTKEQYLESQGKTAEEFERDLEEAARTAVKSQLVLEEIASREDFSVSDTELSDYIVRRASRAGVPADDYARQLVAGGQQGAVFADLLRAKALAFALEHAKITDTAGTVINLDELT